MKENERMQGFLVKSIREYPELSGSMIEMEHEKSGARLAWLNREDQNKTFSIAFKTLPEDSTGVFHILEHSVLCGSKKYPVKEPFVELLKTSVQTFLNAMTFPDKTVYPVSSRNDRDFLNLIDVYLDAVFNPSIYTKPEIFRQEGWRYEGEGEETCYQGVVLNEMKGAFASPRSVLEAEKNKALFPDNCYGFESGGDPTCIPDLTYEQFIANHQKFYHPSNSYISLVGSIDIDSVLSKIDEFLSPYEKKAINFEIVDQKPRDRVVKEVPYEIGEGEEVEGRAIISTTSLLGRFDTPVLNFSANILADYLAGDNDAPLKRAVIDAGLAQEFSAFAPDGTKQSMFEWQAMNTDAEKLDALEKTIRETVESIIKNGIDKERLEACFNSFAFRMRDRDGSGAPRSLIEAISMLDAWLYGGNPEDGLLVESSLNEIKEKLNGDYFEELLKNLFLENSHTVTIVLTPSTTLGKKKAENEAKRLKNEMSAWTEEDINRLKEEAEVLRVWQQTPDSEEALSTIPMLKLSDLNDKPEPIYLQKSEVGGVTVLRHTIGTNLAVFKTYFEANDLSEEELPLFSILSMLLGSLGTKKHSRTALQTAIKNTIGRFNVSPVVYEGSSTSACKILLSASVACLVEQAENAGNLLSEILTETEFDDIALLRDVLQQNALGARMSLPEQGDRYGTMRVASYMTSQGFANENIGGITFMQWVIKMADADDETLKNLLKSLKALADKIIKKDRMTFSCSETTPNAVLDTMIELIPSDGLKCEDEAVYSVSGPRQEGVSIPAQVGFAVTGTNLNLHGKTFSGSIPVLSNLITLVYLWSEIRVQGGAYGCGLRGRENGDVFFHTYRDPQPNRSLNVMAETTEFVKEFLSGNPDLTGFILSSVSSVDPLRASETKMAVAESRFFCGITEEEIVERYHQLIGTTKEDLLALCEVLGDIVSDNALCVVAGDTALEACGNRLSNRISL